MSKPCDSLEQGHDDDINDEPDEQVDPELGLVQQVEPGKGQEEPGDTVTGYLKYGRNKKNKGIP